MITISRQAWSMPECLSACPWGDLDFKDVRWSFATSPWYLSHCQNFIDMESHCWAKSKQNVSHSVTWLELDTLKTQIYTISGFSRSEFLILVHVDCCMHTVILYIFLIKINFSTGWLLLKNGLQQVWSNTVMGNSVKTMLIIKLN